IGRVLRHACKEARKQPVSALVYVGDCCEELFDPLAGLAGELRLLNTPIFVFQEGHDTHAEEAFTRLASVSGGAHARFDLGSRQRLADLLAAVGVWARGGNAALQTLQLSKQSATIAALLEQLDP
ncbi:MAG: VWA domain-containing protein, partial [Pseudomonadota bacterium]